MRRVVFLRPRLVERREDEGLVELVFDQPQVLLQDGDLRAPTTGSNSKKKPPTTSSDGHESRRRREGAAAPRDAEIALLLRQFFLFLVPFRLFVRLRHARVRREAEGREDDETERHHRLCGGALSNACGIYYGRTRCAQGQRFVCRARRSAQKFDVAALSAGCGECVSCLTRPRGALMPLIGLGKNQAFLVTYRPLASPAKNALVRARANSCWL